MRFCPCISYQDLSTLLLSVFGDCAHGDCDILRNYLYRNPDVTTVVICLPMCFGRVRAFMAWHFLLSSAMCVVVSVLSGWFVEGWMAAAYLSTAADGPYPAVFTEER